MQTDVCIRIINEKMNKKFLDCWVFGYTRVNCFWLYDSQSAGINVQSPQSASTSRRLTLFCSLYSIYAISSGGFEVFFTPPKKYP